MKSASDLVVSAKGKAIMVMLDLRTASRQWGPLMWLVIADHLVRLMVNTLAKRSKMIIRSALDTELRQLSLSFQYQGIRSDFAYELFSVFEDFAAGPIILGSIDVEPGVRGLFAAVDGTPCMIVYDKDGEPKTWGVRADENGVAWEQGPVADETPFHFELRRPRRLPEGIVVFDKEQTVPLKLVRLIEE